MKRASSVLMLALAVALLGACVEVLGFRGPDQRPFEHRAHTVKGIHCNACHAGAGAAGEDGPLHLPSTADCVSCHQKPHDDRPCGTCHGLSSTRAAAEAARRDLRFTHREHQPRTSGDCVRCHLDIASGADVLRPRMATCGSCHVHKDQLVQNRCEPCHVSLRDEGVKPDDHLVHGPSFVREHGVRAAADKQLCTTCHAEKDCASCHGVSARILPERLRFEDTTKGGVHRAGFVSRHAEEARGDPGLCTTCHAPSSCSKCHEREKRAALSGGKSPHPVGWLGLPGQRNDHGRAAWREPDQCATCHGGAGEQLCVGCHKVGGPGGNPHAPGFRSRQPKTERPCKLCHGAVL